MYTEFFGFKDEPFRLTPDPEYFYCSPSHEEAIRVIEYGISGRKGFMMLTGEVGTGKTTLCRVLLNQIVDVETALILNPLLSPSEILRSIVRDFDISFDEQAGDGALYNLLVEYFTALYRKGKNALIIVDESQNLMFESLEMIRQISNIEMENAKLVQVLLVGQPELVQKLSGHQYRQLRQRIALKAVLGHFDPSETENYVNYRLQQALRYNKFLFDKDALKLLHKESAGIPRQINQLADLSLLIASSRSRKKVTVSDVVMASTEYYQEELPEKETKGKALPYAIGFILLLVLVYGIMSSGVLSLLQSESVAETIVETPEKPVVKTVEVMPEEKPKTPEVTEKESVDEPPVAQQQENVAMTVAKELPPEECVYLKANLNFRKEPLLINNVIEVLSVHSEHKIVKRKTEWLQIDVNGKEGWITSDQRYVKLIRCGEK
jgi:general secretion pathway protein A